MSQETPPSQFRRRVSRLVPAIDWIPRYGKEQFSGDLIAGIIVAVMLVPQSMAYAVLAGLPPQMGLYASIIPLIIYGLMGTSRALGVGPTAIASVMTASGVNAVATEGTDEYIAFAILLTLLVGVIRLTLGLVRAGFLVNFMSNPVLSGFVNAAALVIAGSQIPALFGLDVARASTFLDQVLGIWRNIGTFSIWTTLVGVGSVVLLLYFQRYFQRHMMRLGVPESLATLMSRTGPLVTAGIATVITWAFALNARNGVAIVGDVPSGFPPLLLPEFESSVVVALLPAALVISLVGFMESITIAKSLASRERERVDANQEFVAIGAANVGSAISGGFTVTGSFSRSVLNFRSGATSGVASIVTASIVLLTVIVLTPLFTYLPGATLSAIVVVAILGLVETATFRRVWSYRRADAITLVITFVAVLVLGIELGIVTGILSAVGLYLWRTSRPSIVELGQIPGTNIYRNVNRHDTITDPRVLLLRVDESLYFANTQRLQDEVNAKLHNRPEMEHLVLVGTAINDVDASALETLEELHLQLSAAGVTMHLAGFKLIVLERLRNTLLLQLVGPSRTHLTVGEAVASINQNLPEDIPYGTFTASVSDQEA